MANPTFTSAQHKSIGRASMRSTRKWPTKRRSAAWSQLWAPGCAGGGASGYYLHMSGELVLVTGGSGFIAAHCILRLLRSGYRVRSTLRSLAREPMVRKMLAVGGARPHEDLSSEDRSSEDLSFMAADLLYDSGWPEAVAGCDYVLHVASPLPVRPPRREEDLIVPARDGTLRVLRASRDAGVRRLVLTSSDSAIVPGHAPTDRPFSEDDWTDLGKRHLTAYVKAKTLAEQAAWDFVTREGGELELAAVNPVVVLGPVLGPDYSASIQLITRLLEGGIPGTPRLSFNVVDVRDVASLHLRAMTSPAAKGERFLASAGGPLTMQEIGRLLKDRLGEAASRTPTRALPDWMLRLTSLFSPTVRQIVPDLGRVTRVSSEKARRLLSWDPRPPEEAILASADSLIDLGLLRR
jgi:nucleoside-diphosphate-sugar epimerase